jgi:uncharacterized protein
MEQRRPMAANPDWVSPAQTPVRIKTRQAAFIVLILVCITVCQYFFAYQNVGYGIGIAIGLVILIYIFLSVFNLDTRIAASAEALALVPLYVVFTSSLPWFFISQQFLLPAVYACVLALCFWHIYRHNLSFTGIINFSKQNLIKYLLLGLAMGIPTGTVEYLILRPAPAAPAFEFQYFFRDSVYMIFFVGLGEELLFRGLIQSELTSAFGWKQALLGTSFLFAVMHMTWRSIPELFFVFGAALILGGLYIKTKSLIAPIWFHAVNNVMLASLAPYIFTR